MRTRSLVLILIAAMAGIVGAVSLRGHGAGALSRWLPAIPGHGQGTAGKRLAPRIGDCRLN